MTPAGILGGRFYFAKNLTVSVFWKSFGGGGSRLTVAGVLSAPSSPPTLAVGNVLLPFRRTCAALTSVRLPKFYLHKREIFL